MLLRDTTLREPPGQASWPLLFDGDAGGFVEALCADALEHPAVHHAYLQRLAAGDVPDPAAALRDFCRQYAVYSGAFPRYLEALLGALDSPRHRELVRENLLEEEGHDPDRAGDVPHTELFRRFGRAVGVTSAYAAAEPSCTTVLIWRDLFLQKCGSRPSGVGLGAIGIGTELVVSRIYAYLLRAVEEHTDLGPEDYRFLTVHIGCDDEHGEQMKAIAAELAEDPSQREALRFGTLSALNLRHAFWDVMLARALAR